MLLNPVVAMKDDKYPMRSCNMHQLSETCGNIHTYY